MDITEVRIKMAEGNDERLQAFCSITFDDSFVVRDIKIIEGPAGLFVAMPARQATTNCPACRGKNLAKALFCGQCGRRLEHRDSKDSPEKLYADIAHPINAACREMIQSAIIAEFLLQKSRSQPEPTTVRSESRHSIGQSRPHVMVRGFESSTPDVSTTN